MVYSFGSDLYGCNNLFRWGILQLFWLQKKGHKDVILILTQRGANLDFVNAISLLEDILYYKCIIKTLPCLLVKFGLYLLQLILF